MYQMMFHLLRLHLIQLHLLLLLLLFSTSSSSLLNEQCPSYCHCDLQERMMTCGGIHLLHIPDSIPSTMEIFILRNSSIRTIPKLAFKRMEQLKEIQIEDCKMLTSIEKFAFKSMKNIRVINFSRCPCLNQIERNVFSGIGNMNGLKILFSQTPIQRIHSGAFRHAQNLREVVISGSDLALSRHAFASITQLDFLTISGISLVEPQLFLNSTRFHIINIIDSIFDLPPNAFDSLSHVHQILIQRCTMNQIASDAFTAISTIEHLEIFDNSIGTLGARAFTGIINIGRLLIHRNRIRTLESPESILSTAIETKFVENEIDCGCDLKWMPSKTSGMLDSNVCMSHHKSRTIRGYINYYCTSSSKHSQFDDSSSSNPKRLSTLQTHSITNHQRMNSISFPYRHIITMLTIIYIHCFL